MLRLRRSFTWQHVASAPHSDFQLTSHIYKHSKLRTPWVHLATSDPHKACAILFRTTPRDDKGAPHCLEHLVLCGSQRFPVRDPFFSMLSRSLNTYMNAWTGADFTAYPFSTLNQKDFENLLRVYLDSVMSPLLRDLDFKQEAVRLEVAEKGLRYGGVVFNEMKGAMTEPDSYFLHQLAKQLLRGTTYACNSGGEPEAIPSLTNAELRAFHQHFYHPSNATILTYGDMDISQTQSLIETEYFHKYDYREVDSAVNAVPRLTSPVRVKLPYASSPAPIDPKAQSLFAVSYLCSAPAADPYTAFCMSVLGSTLHDGQKSPMYLALLESGLGKEYVPGVGFDSSTKEASFTTGVNGCTEASIAKIESAIMATLSTVAEKGLPSDLLESALHQIEIKLKEVKSNYGLMLLSSMMPFALHGTDPLVPLRINEFLERLRKELSAGTPVFQELVRKNLLGNPHKVSMEMTPDDSFITKKNEAEVEKLKKIEEELKQEDRKQIIEESEQLKKLQEAVQNVDILPTLAVSDINPQINRFPYRLSHQLGSIPVHFIEQPTNGITYVRLKTDIMGLPQELGPLLLLYTRLINKMGTKEQSHGDFDNLKDLYTTSGIACTPLVSSLRDSLTAHRESLVFNLGFLDRNTSKAFSLLSELLSRVNFSEHSHINTLVQRSVKARTDDLLRDGLGFASSLAASTITPAASFYESLQTLRYDCKLAEKLMEGSEILKGLEEELMKIHQFAINQHRMEICIHTSSVEQTHKKLLEEVTGLQTMLTLALPKFSEKRPEPQSRPFTPSVQQSYMTLPGRVNFVVESYRSVPYVHPDYPVLSVLAELMSANFLHKEIREKGGAYGSGFQMSSQKGTITLFSYRDPKNVETYAAFLKAISQCAEGNFDARQVDEAKLRAFSKIDKPVAAYEKGLSHFLYDIEDDQRQTNRERMLAAGKNDLIRCAQEYLLEPALKGVTSRVVFGTEEVDKEALRKSGWSVQKPVETQVKAS